MLRHAAMFTAIWFLLFTIYTAEVRYNILGTKKAPFALVTLLIFVVLLFNPFKW